MSQTNMIDMENLSLFLIVNYMIPGVAVRHQKAGKVFQESGRVLPTAVRLIFKVSDRRPPRSLLA